MNIVRKLSILSVVMTLAGAATVAHASDLCKVPTDEWQPKEALQEKLEGQGWKVSRIKVDDGCFEAYAKDAGGRRVEAYFNPKTLEVVKQKFED
ncbi:MAG: PepSY domain-containing protein [Sneathiella sp.]|nr:PepSY domain-containing protein [Sneathiella sp.]